MTQRCCRLETRTLAAFEQALAEGRLAAADHLLCALEALDCEGGEDSVLADAYLSALKPRPLWRRRTMGGLARCN